MPKVTAPAKCTFKIERARPTLPVVAKAEIAVKAYKRPEQKQPELPTIVKPRLQTNLIFKPVGIDHAGIRAGIPKIGMPRVAVPSFVAPKKSRLVLPNISVKVADVSPFRQPELSNIALPTVVKPNVNTVHFHGVKPIQPNLSEIPCVAPVKLTYKKPELLRTKLPLAFKASIKIHSISEIKPVAVDMPKISKVSVHTPDFSKAKSIAVPKVNAVTKVLTPTVKIPSFAKIEHPVTGLPDRIVVVIPNAYETLKEFFPVAKDEAGGLDGIG
jgi:hypothetical protein